MQIYEVKTNDRLLSSPLLSNIVMRDNNNTSLARHRPARNYERASAQD